ncbi:MAG: fatty acyl-AMP ligase [Planctomycetia bacterium]|nr:fatty acyl-AMP ligase [Planctomycetia bacterium]
MRTLIDMLRQHAETIPERVLYTFLRENDQRETLTFAELDDRARTLAGAFLQHAAPGDRALMTYPPGLEFIEAFLGCFYAGIVGVPAYPPKKNRNAERVLAIAHDCEPRLILCTADTRSNVQGEFAAAIKGAEVLLTDEIGAGSGSGLPDITADCLAFLQYTSGSTADPKGVMVSHGNVAANNRLIQKYFDLDHSSVNISWLPMFHDMGLIGSLLTPLFFGFPSVLMAPNTFLREPLKWLQVVTEFAGTITGAPNFAYDLCVRKIASEQRRHLDLSSVKVAYNGAEPVRAETLERFSEAFAECGFRPEACLPCYGMAETTLIVTGGPPLTERNVLTVDSGALEQHRIVKAVKGSRLVSSGQVGPDMEVRIVHHETGVPSLPDEIGEIWVHGTSVTQGYLHRPEETEATFRAKIIGDDRHWLRTGDYGFLRGGELYVTGRQKDLIILRGRNLYPQDVETFVETIFDLNGTSSVAVFSLNGDLEEVLAVVVEANRDIYQLSRNQKADADAKKDFLGKLSACRAVVMRKLDAPLHAFAFLPPGQFPRTSSGKVQRRRCRHALQAGTLPFLVLPGCLTHWPPVAHKNDGVTIANDAAH